MSNTNEKTSYDPIPAGTYKVQMNRIEEKATKAGGIMLSAGFQVTDGDNKGRLIFHNFLVEHSSPKAMEVGLSQLDQYLASVGVRGGLEDLGFDRGAITEYTSIPLNVKVAIEEGTNGYSDRNKITSFKGIRK